MYGLGVDILIAPRGIVFVFVIYVTLVRSLRHQVVLLLYMYKIGCFLKDRQIVLNGNFFFPSSIKHKQTLK